MFHSISKSILDRMAYLERVDARDRQDGTHTPLRLRQVPPQVGRFLALLAAAAPAGQFLEIGTSAGYSGLWLSLACAQRGARLITFELLPEKVQMARETFRAAGVERDVQIVEGDVRVNLPAYTAEVGFCFLDTDKPLYEDCYDQVVPGLVPGGLLVADNVISHAEVLRPFIEKALSDPRLDAVVVPIGQGVLVCRKI